MGNSFGSKTPAELSAIIDVMTPKVSGTSPYGVSQGQLTALTASGTGLTAAVYAPTAPAVQLRVA